MGPPFLFAGRGSSVRLDCTCLKGKQAYYLLFYFWSLNFDGKHLIVLCRFVNLGNGCSGDAVLVERVKHLQVAAGLSRGTRHIE